MRLKSEILIQKLKLYPGLQVRWDCSNIRLSSCAYNLDLSLDVSTDTRSVVPLEVFVAHVEKQNKTGRVREILWHTHVGCNDL